MGVYFADSSTGTAVGYDGTIIRTTDGGDNWFPQTSGTTEQLYCVYFTDVNTGTVAGYPGTILRTTDGGENWFPQTSGTGAGLTGICFADANTGTIVGNGGVILRTTDGGNNWNEQTSGTSVILQSVSFTDANTGTAVGEYGTILHTTNGGVTFIEDEKTNEMPIGFLLSQNYPNPFNPSTKIRYSLSNNSNVVIKVFDVLGNQIETLVNEEKPAGTYELAWNAAILPSGVYFYQLRLVDPSKSSRPGFCSDKEDDFVEMIWILDIGFWQLDLVVTSIQPKVPPTRSVSSNM